MFTGVFDEVSRVQLRRHRHELELSLQETAQVLGVHWTTLAKWESGEIQHCHPRHRRRVEEFLSGEFDNWLGCSEGIRHSEEVKLSQLEPVLREELLHLGCVFQMLNDYPDLQNLLTGRLNRIVEELILCHLKGKLP